MGRSRLNIYTKSCVIGVALLIWSQRNGGEPVAKLTPKQQCFIDEYLACGNATEAARRAGYRQPNVQGAQNLVKLSNFIDEQAREIRGATIADMLEINAFWTSIMRDEDAELKERLKASELRAKVQGAFTERREITFPESSWFKDG